MEDKCSRQKVQHQSQIKGMTEDKLNGDKGTQCFEYEGFVHIKAECPNFLKKQKNGIFATWSNSESEEETANIMMDYSGRCKSDGESITKDLYEE